MYHPCGVRALSGRCLHIHWWDSVCQVRHSRCIIDQTIHDDLWSRFASSIRVAKVQVRKYKYLAMLSHAIIFWTKKASLCNDVEAKVLRLPKDEWVAQFGQKLTENGSKSQRYKRVINAGCLHQKCDPPSSWRRIIPAQTIVNGCKKTQDLKRLFAILLGLGSDHVLMCFKDSILYWEKMDEGTTFVANVHFTVPHSELSRQHWSLCSWFGPELATIQTKASWVLKVLGSWPPSQWQRRRSWTWGLAIFPFHAITDAISVAHVGLGAISFLWWTCWGRFWRPLGFNMIQHDQRRSREINVQRFFRWDFDNGISKTSNPNRHRSHNSANGYVLVVGGWVTILGCPKKKDYDYQVGATSQTKWFLNSLQQLSDTEQNKKDPACLNALNQSCRLQEFQRKRMEKIQSNDSDVNWCGTRVSEVSLILWHSPLSFWRAETPPRSGRTTAGDRRAYAAMQRCLVCRYFLV